MVVGSVGVVYGDIGTSPLYAMREAHDRRRPRRRLTPARGDRHRLAAALDADPDRHAQIRRPDPARRQQRRGRHLSLVALAQRALGRRSPLLFVLGVAGTALFYGDAIITPAISVLSAVEGLDLVTPAFAASSSRSRSRSWSLLFAIQSRGTARVAAFFGPITAGLVPRASAGSASTTSATSRRSSRRSTRSTAVSFLHRRTASARSRSWARSFSRSPAPRRSMPTWAISAAGRSASPGWPRASRPRAQLHRPGQPRARPPRGRCRTPSSCWRRAGACCRWSCSPPWRRSSPARR